MATKRPIDDIRSKAASSDWVDRVAALDLAREMLGDEPERALAQSLVETGVSLATDPKWEVRKAAAPVLAMLQSPAARRALEELAKDDNAWVRQAAERARRRQERITTPAEKKDPRVEFAFRQIIRLVNKGSRTLEEYYEAALLIGERYYEDLAADTAHELNTYRASMDLLLSELETMLRGGREADVAAAVGKIRERSRYLKALVQGLLDYARDVDLHFGKESLRVVVHEAVSLAVAKAQERGSPQVIAQTINVPEDLVVEMCRPRLVQALANVLSNAYESLVRREGPRIEISANLDGTDRVTLTVKDNGCGMDASQTENARKRFRSLKKGQGGIGLGLPLAIKITEREHLGRLTIESEPGIGTTLSMELPLRRQEQN